jgi:hypothetical protein
VLHHLQRLQEESESSLKAALFEGTLRTKATLYSGKILEQRGFGPVEELSKDMATHISRYDAVLLLQEHRIKHYKL